MVRLCDAEVLFFAMPNGIDGKGSHTHNDKLSVVLRIKGEQLLCDSGTYCYLRDGNARNRFRSTAAHNTLTIDGMEQNSFVPDMLFYSENEAHVSPIQYTESGPEISVCASHTGYQRKSDVLHRRTVRMCGDDRMELEDTLLGSGRHNVVCNFQIGPAWRVRSLQEEGKEIVCRLAGAREVMMVFSAPFRLQAMVERAEISMTFAGKCVAIDKIRVSAAATMPMTLMTRVSWSRNLETEEGKLEEHCVEQ
jgi:hypothetical protein